MKLSLSDELEIEMDASIETFNESNRADKLSNKQNPGTDMLMTLRPFSNNQELKYIMDTVQPMPVPRTSRSLRIVDYLNAMVPVRPGGDCKADEKVERILEHALEQVKSRAGQVLGTLAFDMPHDRLKVEESVLANFLTDAIRTETGADIAFQTSSGIRDSLYKGPLKYGDLYRVFPFDNITATVELTGTQVKKILEHSATQVKEYMQVSGLTQDIERNKPAGERVSHVKVNGEPLEPERKYTIAVNDLLMKGGFGYSEFSKGDNITYGKLQRENLMDYMAGHADVTAPPSMGRLNYKS
jgi:2',3'-cyclic-nucleotide 2'-phosphodiesterase (5'-nucleotidase family)